MIKITKIFKDGGLEETELGQSDVLEQYEEVLERMQDNECETINLKFERGAVLFVAKQNE